MNEFLAKNRRVVMGLGVVVGLSIAVISREMTNSPMLNAPKAVEVPDTPERLVERHLKWAEENCIAGVGQEIKPVEMFFSDSRLNTRRFAEVALGSDSKWLMVKDFFTGRSEHPAFMRERFEAIVFKQADLDALVEGVVAAYLRHLSDTESQLLVKLEADLTNLPRETYSGFVDRTALAQRLESALHDAMTAAQADLQSAVGREVVSWIAGEVIGQATLSLATSSGIIGAGAASGAVTFGVGVIVAFIVDAIVSEIYNEMYDPAGELAKQVAAHLTGLEALIVNGTSDAPGLVTRLRECASRRGATRREAIRAAVFPLAM